MRRVRDPRGVTLIDTIVEFEEVALDQGTYHRQYWTHWQQLPEDMSVAAMTRDCELVCRVLQEQVILGTSTPVYR